jgi:hypothetical protein
VLQPRFLRGPADASMRVMWDTTEAFFKGKRPRRVGAAIELLSKP